MILRLVDMRRRVFAIPLGVIILLMGSVWFLQGVGILPGSIMSGSEFWVVAGGLVIIIGLGLIGVGATGRKSSTPTS